MTSEPTNDVPAGIKPAMTPPPSSHRDFVAPPRATRKVWPAADEVGESSRMGGSRSPQPSLGGGGSRGSGALSRRNSRFVEDLEGVRREGVHAMVTASSLCSRETLETLSTVNRTSHDGGGGAARGGCRGLRRLQPPAVSASVPCGYRFESTRRGGNRAARGRADHREEEKWSGRGERAGRKVKGYFGSFVGVLRKVAGSEKKDKGKGREIYPEPVPEAWWTEQVCLGGP